MLARGGSCLRVHPKNEGDEKEEDLLDFPAALLAIPLPSKRLFHALLFSGLQVERMLFDFFDDVFLLHFPLKTPKQILEGFALLNFYFSQTVFTSLAYQMWRRTHRKAGALCNPPQRARY